MENTKHYHQQTIQYPTYFVSNNKHISENKAIANGFNNYFTNVGFNLAKNISSPDKDVFIYDYLGEGCNGSMFLIRLMGKTLLELYNFKTKCQHIVLILM